MGKRLNDTIAVKASMPSGSSSYQHSSKTIRKIDNGYVTSMYGDGTASTEIFTAEHPDSPANAVNSGDAMKRAVDYMKKC